MLGVNLASRNFALRVPMGEEGNGKLVVYCSLVYSFQKQCASFGKGLCASVVQSKLIAA